MRNLFRKRIYLDYASATPISKRCIRAMNVAYGAIGNPGAIHAEGIEARESLSRSRELIAQEIGSKPRELVFTSGITESNNLAILGRARALQAKGELEGSHWIVSAIEHASVLECFLEVERLGAEVSRVAPDARGIILPDVVAARLKPNTVFVSVGLANNEIGTIQPLSEIMRMLRAHEKAFGSKVIFHSDAGQGPLYLSPQVHTLGVDLFSFGASKLYGPHGIAGLYVSSRAELVPLILGGGQERALRSGTESVALAAGFAEAMRAAADDRQAESRRLSKLRDAFARELTEKLSGAIINGDLKRALPHMLNISVPGIQGEYAMLSLDRAGIAVSTKSACSEGDLADSHVIRALTEALPDAEREAWRASHALRFSLGKATRASDLRSVARVLGNIF